MLRTLRDDELNIRIGRINLSDSSDNESEFDELLSQNRMNVGVEDLHFPTIHMVEVQTMAYRPHWSEYGELTPFEDIEFDI